MWDLITYGTCPLSQLHADTGVDHVTRRWPFSVSLCTNDDKRRDIDVQFSVLIIYHWHEVCDEVNHSVHVQL